MYNKRMQYSASAARYLAALPDPRYRRQSQHVTREQRKLAEQLLIKLAIEDGSEGDRPTAEALSQLAIWQQPGVVLFSRTSLSAVYFAPQLTTSPLNCRQWPNGCCASSTAAANERVFSAFSHVWSDKRASLILGRMWIMAYIYFNKQYRLPGDCADPISLVSDMAEQWAHNPVENSHSYTLMTSHWITRPINPMLHAQPEGVVSNNVACNALLRCSSLRRVMDRKPKTLSDADWEEYERWMRKPPQDQN
ncbi:hypothetical protein QJQ45_016745 [Haematococcus lacustris]|nr:hypothetical protein QJQ45_016745 [Haematococcus lacustris]